MKTSKHSRFVILCCTLQLFVLLLLPGCQSNRGLEDVSTQTQPPLLNSERIRQKFGSYGIEVLQANTRVRVANLYSLSGDHKVTRTLAIVLFPEVIPMPILPEHELILDGGSIGEVFKSHGWRVEKKNLYSGEVKSSQDFAGTYEMMSDIPASDLAVHGYDLSVRKGAEHFSYATILEVHHPDYLTLDELESIYFAGSNKENSEEGLPLPVLEIIRDSLPSY